ncbi:rhamnan synthesis F family protein [Streptococcus suis]|uniref:rhamnan synthesis F family protein n=1 Tax=Streptococcus suis TaxID=1307 RepID=UPI0038B8AE5B
MKRLLLYVHYNKYDKLSSHVVYQLEKMRPLFEEVLFISNSKLSKLDQERLETSGLITDFLQRKNSGFDFVAWKDGFQKLGFEHVSSYDSVTIMNDTCYGPIWDIKEVFERFESDLSTDFWGMTNHRATERFKEHLQSYFVTFKKQVVQSPEFKNFWSNVREYTIVQDVIDYLESPVTNIFVDAGFNYKAVFDTTTEELHHMPLPDFSYYNVAKIIEKRVPFIKVKALEGNPQQTSFVIDELAQISEYPTELIVEHMSNMFTPAAYNLLKYKYLDKNIQPEFLDKKVAIHLHTYYVDLLESFLDIFSTFTFAYDLYLTTDKEDKAEQIREILSKREAIASVHVTGNRGRDVLPMLKLKEQLSNYDFIGHFHTKKSLEAEFWAGESWRRELLEMLVKPSDAIVSQLAQNDKLGLVIADIPTYFRYISLDPFYEGALSTDMNALWKRMKMKKDLDFQEFSTYVMSYGTYVWFRYDALKPLFDIDIQDEEVPEEPLPLATILHSIERMLVYIAWGNDYDFLISQNPVTLPPFVDVTLLNKREGIRFNPVAPVDFTYFGGLTGALKYFFFINKSIAKYVIKRLLKR